MADATVIPTAFGDRRVLPQRRFGYTVKYEHDGLPYIATFNGFEDGEIAEMFLNAGKTGTTANIIAKECAVLFSLARQYGAPIKVLQGALPLLRDGTPAGPCGMALRALTETADGKDTVRDRAGPCAAE